MAAPLAAETPRATTTSFGIYEDPSPVSRHFTHLGYRTTPLKVRTTKVPAVLNVSFGMCYRVSGFPADKSIHLYPWVNHPPLGSSYYTGSSAGIDPLRNDGGTGESCFLVSLRNKDQLVPGRWTLEIRGNSETPLLKQDFDVVPAP